MNASICLHVRLMQQCRDTGNATAAHLDMHTRKQSSKCHRPVGGCLRAAACSIADSKPPLSMAAAQSVCLNMHVRICVADTTNELDKRHRGADRPGNTSSCNIACDPACTRASGRLAALCNPKKQGLQDCVVHAEGQAGLQDRLSTLVHPAFQSAF